MDKNTNNGFSLLQGEENLWNKLYSLKPEDICKNACVKFDHNQNGYEIKSLNTNYLFLLNKKIIPEMHPHLRFLTLLYLTSVCDISPTGKLKALHEIKNGQFFFKGSHELPLKHLANKFGKTPDEFCKKCASLGGEKVSFGDIAFRLYPFQKFPLVYIFWKGDEEFPPQITLLIDETAEKQIVLEGLWGLTFYTTQMMIKD